MSDSNIVFNCPPSELIQSVKRVDYVLKQCVASTQAERDYLRQLEQTLEERSGALMKTVQDMSAKVDKLKQLPSEDGEANNLVEEAELVLLEFETRLASCMQAQVLSFEMMGNQKSRESAMQALSLDAQRIHPRVMRVLELYSDAK